MDILPRQALHAQSLGFIHPRTGKKMFFESELPHDFATGLEKWRNYVTYQRNQKLLEDNEGATDFED
jgi:23S rRNA pseudouridine1911/1915/1917 synthase